MYSPTICCIILVFSLFCQLNQADLIGKCNECNEYGFQCQSENTYWSCVNPTVTHECRPDYVCIDDPRTCVPKADNDPICYYSPSNDTYKCSNCEFTRGLFACIDETTYAFCCGSMVPNMNLVHQCPEDYYCNLEDIRICTARWVAGPSCGIRHTPTEPAIAGVSIDNAVPSGALTNCGKTTT